MKQRGEKRLERFADRVEAKVGKLTEPGTKRIGAFTIFYNPTDTPARVGRVRLRQLEGVVKTDDGRAVIRFDGETGVTYDAKLAGPLFEIFQIPQDDQP